MRENEYVAALDLGSTRIRLMAARKNDQGMLSVITAKEVNSEGSIRRGVVYNINDTTKKVRETSYAFKRDLRPELGKIYVGVGGQSVHSRIHTVRKEVSGEIVSQEIIDSLREECKAYVPESWEVLAISSPEYRIDGKVEAKPVGVVCQVIEADYRLILGRPTLMSNLNKAIKDRILIDIAGYIVAPLATAEAVLTQSEKDKGCALVELGGGVTYVSVYKGNILRYLVTIPLGGEIITKDLSEANLSYEEAASLKHGEQIEDKEYDGKKFETILQSRCEEIVDNVIEQLNQSGYARQLEKGIAVTGGSSNLFELRDMLEKKTGIEVRQATTKKTLIHTACDWASDPAFSAIIGMLSLAEENCAKERREPTPPASTPQPEPAKPADTDLFGQPIHTREKEKRKEKERKLKEREEKIRDPKPPRDPLGLGKRFKKYLEGTSEILFGEHEEDTEEDSQEEDKNTENR